MELPVIKVLSDTPIEYVKVKKREERKSNPNIRDYTEVDFKKVLQDKISKRILDNRKKSTDLIDERRKSFTKNDSNLKSNNNNQINANNKTDSNANNKTKKNTDFKNNINNIETDQVFYIEPQQDLLKVPNSDVPLDLIKNL